MRKHLSKDSAKHFLIVMSAAAVVTLGMTPNIAHAEEQTEIVTEVTEESELVTVEGITGWYEDDWGRWYYYYPSDGSRAYGLTTIGGYTYYFDDWMLTDTSVQKDGVIYHFDSQGHLDGQIDVSVDGWVNAGGDWYYVRDQKFVTYEWIESGGYWYYMDYRGKMVKDDVVSCYDANSGLYYTYGFDQDGHMVTGWRMYSDYDGNSWYYFDANGHAANGARVLSGQTYIFENGRMRSSEAVIENGVLYYLGKDGTCEWQVSAAGDGWKKTQSGYYYVKNGTLLKGCFIQDGGYSYYLGYDGVMYEDTEAYIYHNGDYVYRFAKDGHVVTGWYVDEGGVYYYSTADGHRMSGILTIDGGTYYFSESGVMKTDCSVEQNGVLYSFGEDGRLSAQIQMNTDGWKETSDGVYYVKGGTLVKSDWVQIDGDRYYMDESGAKVTDVTSYLIGDVAYSFGKDGKMQTGWQVKDGESYYFGTDGKSVSGLQTIAGQTYYIGADGRVAMNTKIVWDGVLYQANGSGVCTPYTAVQTGWVDDIYYIQNGRLVRGWVCSYGIWYYLDANYRLVSGTTCTIDGMMYAFDSNGAMRTGWIQTYPDGWSYAYPSGALAVGWAYVGGVWYYFDTDADMVTGLQYIEEDGQYHLFSSSGAWIGGVNAGLDQWYSDEKDWYYIQGGNLAKWETVQTGNAIYGFDWDGTMLENEAATFSDGTYYFGGDGCAYRSQWRETDTNEWYYYDAAGLEVEGEWKNVGGVWYYFDTDGHMLQNCSKIVDGKLNFFDASGAWLGENSALSGWILDDGYWHFFTNGKSLTGWNIIGQDTYFFHPDGRMAYNSVREKDGSLYWLNKDGKLVVNGWAEKKDSEHIWYYAGADGKLYCGLQIIGGKQYAFSDKGALYTQDSLSEDGSILYQHNWDDSITQIAASGVNGWYCTTDGAWVYAHGGRFVTGLQTIDGVQYYFDENGRMAHHTYFDDRFYADASGALHFGGWQGSYEDGWYYLRNGYGLNGAQTVGGGYYMFSYGENKEGLYFADGNYYYYDGNGTRTLQNLKQGWNLIANNWYYMEKDGLCRGIKWINGAYYNFSYDDGRMENQGSFYEEYNGTKVYVENGALATGWRLIDGKWYYFDVNGHALKGTHNIWGINYTFTSDGVWVER